jgi:hypothetical protein
MQRSPNPLPPRPFGPCGPPSPHTRFPSSLSLLGGPALSAQPRAPALPLPRGPGLPAACPHPPFAQYPVPPPPRAVVDAPTTRIPRQPPARSSYIHPLLPPFGHLHLQTTPSSPTLTCPCSSTAWRTSRAEPELRHDLAPRWAL